MRISEKLISWTQKAKGDMHSKVLTIALIISVASGGAFCPFHGVLRSHAECAFQDVHCISDSPTQSSCLGLEENHSECNSSVCTDKVPNPTGPDKPCLCVQSMSTNRPKAFTESGPPRFGLDSCVCVARSPTQVLWASARILPVDLPQNFSSSLRTTILLL